MRTLGVVLAGGKSERMGSGTKALKEFNGEPIYQRILQRLRPQVDHVVLNSNDDPQTLKTFGMPVIADVVPGRIGPLSGILSGLYYCEYAGCNACLVVPCDAPFFPCELLDRFQDAMVPGKPVYAVSADQPQPIFSLWPLDCLEALESLIVEDGKRSVLEVLTDLGGVAVNFPEEMAFMNLNTPMEWQAAEQRASQGIFA